MNPKQIRLRICDLLDTHGDTYSGCTGCLICTEIKQLGGQLNRDPAEKLHHILAKGQDMTKSDIALLLDSEVTVKTIRKYADIPRLEFHEMMKNLGFSKNVPERGRRKEMAKITLEMYKDLKAKGFSDKEIAQKQEMNPQYLSQMKKKWYQDEETVLKEVRGVSETPTIQEDKTAEYERLIQALRKDLTDAHTQCDEKDELIHKLQNAVEKYENLSAACEDVESEIASVQEENGVLKKRVEELEYTLKPVPLQCDCEVKVNRLQEENQAMRQLLKLWM